MFVEIIYWISLFVQLFFILIIFGKFAFFFEKTSKKASLQAVSIIIAARNEKNNLKKLIPELLSQHFDNFEIIIINDRSTDGSMEFLDNIESDKLHIIHVTEETGFNGKKNALNLGIKRAKNDILLFTDADCMPKSKEWIAEMQAGFIDNIDLVLAYSPYQAQKNLLNSLIRYETLYTAIQFFSLAIWKNPYMAVGRNMAYRKSWFLKNGGFADLMTVTGGDDDLPINRWAKAENTNIVIGENSIMPSIPKTTWKEWFLQKKRHLSVGKKYHVKDQLILGILTLTGLLWWICSFLYENSLFLCAGFVVRWLAMYFVFNKIKIKIGEPLNLFLLPILDFLYYFYYLTIGLISWLNPKITWK